MGELHMPIEGNGYIERYGEGDAFEKITKFGIENWQNLETTWAVYFHINIETSVSVFLRIKGPSQGSSLIEVSLGNQRVQLNIGSGNNYIIIPVGLFQITTRGYQKFEFKGISRTGKIFVDVIDFILQHNTGEVWYVPDDFYFGRRGPSVHWRYDLPAGKELEYFYTEVTVPRDEDIIGSYYAAAGFSGGYLGIQVNGENERRALFSIWSEFDSDDPGEVPDDFKVVPLRSGRNVHVGEFGNEGTGAQSYLLFPWKTDVTYKFLVYSVPIDDNNTIYTGWVFDSEVETWLLMASFRKPKVSYNLRGLYAFSENFIPENGNKTRRALYGNQWCYTTEKNWEEVTKATFTGDETSRKSRLDYSGGVDPQDGKLFYLRNCGFFSDNNPTNEDFEREPNNIPPIIDFENLP